MGKVVVGARIENLGDLYAARLGHRADADVRRVDVAEALVDAGATGLSLPRSLIDRLGLAQVRGKIFEAVRLTIQGRDCLGEVAELPEGCPVLIGQVPLGSLDFVVDPVHHRLIGNPAHGGEHVLELY